MMAEIIRRGSSFVHTYQVLTRSARRTGRDYERLFVGAVLCHQNARFPYFLRLEDGGVLQHFIASYCGFLRITSFLAPTLGIDLALRTHQLMTRHHSRDIVKFAGVFIDHDDNVDESKHPRPPTKPGASGRAGLAWNACHAPKKDRRTVARGARGRHEPFRCCPAWECRWEA
ncbi:hypothetical protein MSAN_00432000 [Mycena sanguinolenta]|uniref:Uncharacterized protein n=1 Tax=Mycena sanguinolenta TaxID=230812 RepID=A0A8H6ZFR8_9AGAR|nr:hypothetical protein MSAN_00432000 [Mycena sanguinolenta]